LPEWARDVSGNSLAEPVKKYIFDVTARWMDPEGNGDVTKGVDGWRLDVAYCVPHGFWKEWHAWVRNIKPEAYTTGEIVGPAGEWLKADEFTAVMNYMWLFPTLSFFTPHKKAIPAPEFRRRLTELWERYPSENNYALQNLLDSHDTGRILTMLESSCPPFEHWDAYFHWARAFSQPEVCTTKPDDAAKTALKLAVIWQMTGLGAPMIYYGTEVGMWGANDPCDRQPMFWEDIPLDPETAGVNGPVGVQGRNRDVDLFRHYQHWIRIRKQEDALRRGTFRWASTPGDETIAYTREYGNEAIWCVIHKGKQSLQLSVPFNGINLETAQPISAGDVTLPPACALIVKRKIC
jgi:glycosidase